MNGLVVDFSRSLSARARNFSFFARRSFILFMVFLSSSSADLAICINMMMRAAALSISENRFIWPTTVPGEREVLASARN